MILITGTPGWMGTQLVGDLSAQGKKFRCLVLPGTNVAALKPYGVEIVTGDITDPASLSGICRDVETVIHCAGIIHPRQISGYYNVNTNGTINLATEGKKAGIRRFVYVSSSSAGSGYSSPRLTTEDEPPRPYMHYGKSKLLAEQALGRIFAGSETSVVIIRPHFLYGIAGPERQLRLFRMIAKPRPFMFGSGQNVRSLCGVNNCVQALVRASDYTCRQPEAFYIADESPYTINQVYDAVAKAVGRPIRPIHLPMPKFSTWSYSALDQGMQWLRFYASEIHLAWDWAKNIASDISKAKRELGYAPRQGLEDGIAEAVQGYRSQGIVI